MKAKVILLLVLYQTNQALTANRFYSFQIICYFCASNFITFFYFLLSCSGATTNEQNDTKN